MSRPSALGWIVLALLGLAVAAGASVAASRLAGQRIGLESEPIRAGDQLAPPQGAATTPIRRAQRRRAVKPPVTTTTTRAAPPVTSPPSGGSQSSSSGTSTSKEPGEAGEDRGGEREPDADD